MPSSTWLWEPNPTSPSPRPPLPPNPRHPPEPAQREPWQQVGNQGLISSHSQRGRRGHQGFVTTDYEMRLKQMFLLVFYRSLKSTPFSGYKGSQQWAPFWAD